MRNILIVIFILIYFSSFSQNKVTGIIKDIEGNSIPGANLIELGTTNGSTSDIDGRFKINTIKDSCIISFSWIGYETKTVTITNDTTINIVLGYWGHKSNWLTIGSAYDAYNSTLGLSISNGFDELPLIHFEDFSESWIYKISGSTNFSNDYSFEAKLGYDYVFKYLYMPAVEYRKIEYPSENLQFTDINLSFSFGLRRFWGRILLESGYQNLNGENNFGAGIGWQNGHRNPDLYYGFIIGYWTNYLTYNVYLQSFIYKNKLSIRVNYERIEIFNFLNFGVNYTFNR